MKEQSAELAVQMKYPATADKLVQFPVSTNLHDPIERGRRTGN